MVMVIAALTAMLATAPGERRYEGGESAGVAMLACFTGAIISVFCLPLPLLVDQRVFSSITECEDLVKDTKFIVRSNSKLFSAATTITQAQGQKSKQKTSELDKSTQVDSGK